MTDRRRTSAALVRHRDTRVLTSTADDALTASARIMGGWRDPNAFSYASWQDELWDYLDTIGEFSYAHWWLAQSISRVVPFAAALIPGEEDPEPIDDGLAADIAAELVNSELWEKFGLHIPLTGKCFMVTTQRPLVGRVSEVKSADEIRPSQRGSMGRDPGLFGYANPAQGRVPRYAFEEQVDEGVWVPLEQALVSEIKHDHPRWSFRSTSGSKAAIPILREISLYDRHITAVLLSRLAMNGMILFPEGMTFPVNPAYKGAPDPFIAEWIDIASRNIKNPGNASAALPYPLRLNEKFIDKITHLQFAGGIDPKIIEARREAVTRLATTMNMSRERITGMGEVNHWGTWEIKEDEVSMHITPPVELICQGLTKTFLRPLLAAAGQPLRTPEGYPIVITADYSRLTTKPDLSQNAEDVFMQGLLSPTAYLRYKGLNEADMPTKKELAQVIMLRQALAPNASPQFLEELTGVVIELDPSGPAVSGSTDGTPPPGEQEVQGSPDRQSAEPTPVPNGG